MITGFGPEGPGGPGKPGTIEAPTTLAVPRRTAAVIAVRFIPPQRPRAIAVELQARLTQTCAATGRAWTSRQSRRVRREPSRSVREPAVRHQLRPGVRPDDPCTPAGVALRGLHSHAQASGRARPAGMQCCGEPFAVRSQVSWTLGEADADWLDLLLGARASDVDCAEEHHGGFPVGK